MKLPITYFLSIAFLFPACSSKDELEIERAIRLSEKNSLEIRKVLEHFQDDPEKLAAAKFLIKNMPGHSGVGKETVSKLNPIYDKHVAISSKHQWSRDSDWKHEIDSLWNFEKGKIEYLIEANNQDIRAFKADWLIREIDRSFKAWKENAYTRNDSFENFCRYILPYRFAESICLDNSREIFYQRHFGLFRDTAKDFRNVTDSLHCLYKDLMHYSWAATSMPIYNVQTFEKIKRGSCDNKAWYNCLMMSALGMGVAIDFVPAWGNRERGHSWNSLIIDGETYPFEPFWDEDRWKYKRVYNNEGFDRIWGTFKLPKVYRRTYEFLPSDPSMDKDVDRDDIPHLFRNPFITDVSSQYFKTSDIKIKITEPIPENAKYCYLCVYGAKDWVPVQWGKIEEENVNFKDMGRDIAYLPMFYVQGALTPAAPAFILNRDGTIEELQCKREDRISITIQTYTSHLPARIIAKTNRAFGGGCFIGRKDDTDCPGDTLCLLADSINTLGEEIKLQNSQKYRYVDLILPGDTVGLCECSFYESANRPHPLKKVKATADVIPFVSGEDISMTTDGLSATGFYGQFKSGNRHKITFDLGGQRCLKKISYIPYIESNLPADKEVELQYWDKKWIKGGSLKGNYLHMTFNDIPKGTLYRVKIAGLKERFFIYKNGIIKWF